MIGTVFLFIVAAVLGWRRAIVDAKAVGMILSYGLVMTTVVVTGTLSMKPWLAPPGPSMWLLAFLAYALPPGAGYAIGVAAKTRRVATDREADGTS